MDSMNRGELTKNILLGQATQEMQAICSVNGYEVQQSDSKNGTTLTPSNIIDVNKGALTIKLESEDIIAMHPPDTLSEIDHSKTDKSDFNTHFKEAEASQTTYHDNKAKSANANTLP